MAENENENSEALAILAAPATAAPATAGDMAPTAAVPAVPGTLTPAAAETAAAVPSPSPGGGSGSGPDFLYKPMFSQRTEKFIYVVCVLLGLGAIIVSVVAGDLTWPKVVSDMCGVIGGLIGSVASAFGVSYTTMRSM